MQYITKKTKTHKIILTAGENLIDYPGVVSTPTSDLTTMKIHVNSPISDVKSRYMCMDVKYFNINNQMDRDEYIMIQIVMKPQEFAYKYNIKEKLHNGYIFLRVTKGNVWTPPSSSDRTLRPGKTTRSVWITPLKKKQQTVETQQLTNKLYIDS